MKVGSPILGLTNYGVSFGEKENPQASSLKTNPGLIHYMLTLSHWTHGRGVKVNLPITVRLEASTDSSCLCLSHNSQIHGLIVNKDLLQAGLWAWGGLTTHCLSRYSRYSPP